MSTIPSIPPNAPFDAQQRAWLAGIFSDTGTTARSAPAGSAVELKPLLVMYGSQSGSAEGLAKGIGREAKTKGFEPRVLELNDYKKVELEKESNVLILTSTWGEGDPPDNAVEFWDFIRADDAPRLENLNYSVLALGDTSYSEFCGAGKSFDDRLAQLGAKRFEPRMDCDVDYEDAAAEWTEAVWKALSNGAAAPAELEAKVEPEDEKPKWSRKNPFPAKLLTNLKLNADGTAKDTRHFEISLKGSGLEYEVGDALGVLPTNCPDLVEDLVKTLGCTGDETVPDPDGNDTNLRDALFRSYLITQLSPKFVAAVAEKTGDAELKALSQKENKDRLNEFMFGREFIDLLIAHPSAKFEPAEFIGYLRKLQPRLYSISSSPKAYPGEVHLTVAAVRYESHGRHRKGVCSTFLADRLELGETPLPVFTQPSHGFKPPTSKDLPMIMVGPGTGIAPFRAFLEERQATKAKGKNWLFFGDQKKDFDYLYQDQLEEFQKDGFLTRLDLAFSRDQDEKVYVQNRMEENAAELWQWLEEGAHFYICGDAKRMAKDVDHTLHKIIETEGGKTEEETKAYVKQLKADKRYQRDVY
jgi:sulfite reductase (NADPH) flavoprotein alpha-component